MTRRRLISGFGLVGWSLAGLGLAWGCGADPKPRGQLMIAVSADMSIPKNMNQVVVQVLDESGFEQKFTYPIRPENLGHPMPGTLAILPPNAGGQHVRVRVLAQRDDGLGDPTIRVMREAAVNVPTDRVAMLAMPLRWLCDGKVSKAADGSLTSDCGKGKTCAAGACVSATVDEKALPAYSPALVFGGGDDKGNGGECMDVQSCFASSVVVTPDGSCTVAIPAGASADSLNVAMVLAPGGDGHCVKNADGSEGRCFLPLDRDPVEGWHEESGRIQLPPVVCAPETVKKIQAVALTTSCKAKDLSVPLCGPWTNVERPLSIDGKPTMASGRDSGVATRAPDAGRPTSHGDASVVTPSRDAGPTPGTDAAASCSGQSFSASPEPVDMYIMFDQSSSMGAALPGSTGTWWTAAQAAVTAFVNDPKGSGMGVGLQFFPLNGVAPATCQADYQTPEVEIGLLPGNAPALVASIQKHVPTAFTPTGPALQGAINHMKAWGPAHPGRAPVVVLVTDGFPTECAPQQVVDIATIAKTAFESEPRVRTFVLGFETGGGLANLKDISQAGGSGAPILISGGDVGAQFAAAMIGISTATLQCDLDLPTPAGLTTALDPSKLGVRYTPTATGIPEQVPRLGSLGDCLVNQNQGWYYDAPGAPKKVLICSGTCAKFTAGKPEMVSGCTPVKGVSASRDAGAGGGLGAGGTSGGGGGSAGSASAGRGGSAGAAGSIGTGGAAAPVCTSSGQCTAQLATPYCDVAGGKCVACLGNANCASGGAPVCNLTTHACVVCVTSADCPVATPVCNTVSGTCGP